MKALKNKKIEEPQVLFMLGEVVSTYVRKQKVETIKITNSEDAKTILRTVWDDSMEYTESFYALYLNMNNKVIGWALISKGGVVGTVADPKVIIKKALDLNAVGIILSHNHPSGNLCPSQADIQITRKIKSAAEFFDMRVLDHVIMTADSHYSMADNGSI